MSLRQEIKDSVNRMTKEDREDVAITCGLKHSTKSHILLTALENEDVAEYVLQY